MALRFVVKVTTTAASLHRGIGREAAALGRERRGRAAAYKATEIALTIAPQGSNTSS